MIRFVNGLEASQPELRRLVKDKGGQPAADACAEFLLSGRPDMDHGLLRTSGRAISGMPSRDGEHLGIYMGLIFLSQHRGKNESPQEVAFLIRDRKLTADVLLVKDSLPVA